MLNKFLGILLLTAASLNVNAATFQYLHSPALVGELQGSDLLWNTADDFNTLPPGFTGFNPLGGATNFLFDGVAIFGSVVGSFETAGPEQIGANTLTSLSADIFINNFALLTPIVADPASESLSASDTSTLNIAVNNTATSTMIIDVTGSGPANTFTLTGNYGYISNGDDPNVIFAGNADLISQFNYLMPLLPSNWDKFFIGTENFIFLTGETGKQSGAFYTTSAVPLPAAVWLFGTAIIGLAGVTRRN